MSTNRPFIRPIVTIFRKAAEALSILNKADVVDVNEADAIRDVVNVISDAQKPAKKP